MIRISDIKIGDRIGFRANGSVVTRTVSQVGSDYAVIMVNGAETKIPAHRITSHIKR